MKHNTYRALAAAALLVVAVSLAGCSMTPVTIDVEFAPNPISLELGEPFDVSVSVTVNGVGLFWLDAIQLTLEDSLGNPVSFPPGAGVENPYIVDMKERIFVPGLAGTVFSAGLLSQYIDDDVRTLPLDAWLLEPRPSSLAIEFIDTKGKVRGGGTLQLDWTPITL